METKDWRQMTDEERVAIQDDVTLRQLEEHERQLSDARKRVVDIVGNNRIWSIADLQLFINKVNSLARRLNCLDELPTKVYPSREEFLEDAVTVLYHHGASDEDVAGIFEINKQLNDGKVG